MGIAVSRVRGQVQFGDEIGFALVQIDGARMNLEKGDARLRWFPAETPVEVSISAIIFAGSGADVNVLRRIGDTRRKIPLDRGVLSARRALTNSSLSFVSAGPKYLSSSSRQRHFPGGA